MAHLATVDADLRKNLVQLSEQWKALNITYETFAKTKLEFAQQISRIWAQAKDLDKQAKSEANQNHFREKLRAIIQSDNKSILSKWVGIGDRAQQLLPYASSLPPQRDSLYVLSTAIAKKKPIQKWIDNGKLSSESTVREVMALSVGTTRKSALKRAQKQRNITVSLEFTGNYESTAKLLKHLVHADDLIFIRADKALSSALAAQFSKEEYAQISYKVEKS